jgi:hypothetical protein
MNQYKNGVHPTNDTSPSYTNINNRTPSNFGVGNTNVLNNNLLNTMELENGKLASNNNPCGSYIL